MAAVNALLYVRNLRSVRQYRRRNGQWPNVAAPQRYSERMLWRKLVDRNPLFVTFADKLATKEFIRSRCPELPLARVLWVGDDADAIPDEVLRGDVFVKASHGSDFNRRVRGGRCDRAELREQTRRWLGAVYGRKSGEWNYWRVKPRLFVEADVSVADVPLLDFHLRASNGRIVLGSISVNAKTPAEQCVYLDGDGNPVPGMAAEAEAPAVPAFDLSAALEPYRRAGDFARRLSAGVDYARFDFFWNGQVLLGGEITVFPAGGVDDPADPTAHADVLKGWDLLQADFLRSPSTGWRRWYAAALKRRLEKRAAVS